MSRPISGKVLLGVCGGIAAYKAPDLVRRLRERGCEVRCALTPAAKSFVSRLALEIVSGSAVYEEEYLEPTGDGEELHIAAAEWADLILIAPATSHFLASAALGLAGNFLLTTLAAFRGPVLMAPAMHSEMWQQGALGIRINELESRGVELLGPEVGPLANGEVGIGRMAEVAAIVAAAVARLGSGALAGERLLITAGPTFEALDPVRYLGNRSSGKMGFAIAAAAAKAGAEVILIAGPVALPSPPGVRRIDVETALEMEAAVRAESATSSIVVMAAAVADFRPRNRVATKIKKSPGLAQVELVPNPDILSQVAGWAPGALIVGFAAETGALEAEAGRKLAEKGAHLLVANDVSRSDIGFGADDNEVLVMSRFAAPRRWQKRSKRELAAQLVELFGSELRALRAQALPTPR